VYTSHLVLTDQPIILNKKYLYFIYIVVKLQYEIINIYDW